MFGLNYTIIVESSIKQVGYLISTLTIISKVFLFEHLALFFFFSKLLRQGFIFCWSNYEENTRSGITDLFILLAIMFRFNYSFISHCGIRQMANWGPTCVSCSVDIDSKSTNEEKEMWLGRSPRCSRY